MTAPSYPTDVLENALRHNQLLQALLVDQTRAQRDPNAAAPNNNIRWCTTDYLDLGPDYAPDMPIGAALVTGEQRGTLIQPRVLKSKSEQAARVRSMAEVYTPAWIVNLQNNTIDQAWFGRPGVFSEPAAGADGAPAWLATSQPVAFPKGKTWRDYVADRRLEITCGEAPYLASRYDATTGQPIPVDQRIGMLDRKLRVVSENTNTPGEWIFAALDAFKSCYGFEFQGDSLLLARENMLATLLDFYQHRFPQAPDIKPEIVLEFIRVITWNLWQMDGLKAVVPNTCHAVTNGVQGDLFGGAAPASAPCPGCASDNIKTHNGIACLIVDWRDDPQGNKPILFRSTLNAKR